MTFSRYILQTLYRLYQKNLAVCTVLAQYWLAGSKKLKFESMDILNLVLLHVELENVKHGDVSETQILFYCIGLKKFAYKHVNYNIVFAFNNNSIFMYVYEEVKSSIYQISQLLLQIFEKLFCLNFFI